MSRRTQRSWNCSGQLQRMKRSVFAKSCNVLQCSKEIGDGLERLHLPYFCDVLTEACQVYALRLCWQGFVFRKNRICKLVGPCLIAYVIHFKSANLYRRDLPLVSPSHRHCAVFWSGTVDRWNMGCFHHWSDLRAVFENNPRSVLVSRWMDGDEKVSVVVFTEKKAPDNMARTKEGRPISVLKKSAWSNMEEIAPRKATRVGQERDRRLQKMAADKFHTWLSGLVSAELLQVTVAEAKEMSVVDSASVQEPPYMRLVAAVCKRILRRWSQWDGRWGRGKKFTWKRLGNLVLAQSSHGVFHKIGMSQRCERAEQVSHGRCRSFRTMSPQFPKHVPPSFQTRVSDPRSILVSEPCLHSFRLQSQSFSFRPTVHPSFRTLSSQFTKHGFEVSEPEFQNHGPS